MAKLTQTQWTFFYLALAFEVIGRCIEAKASCDFAADACGWPRPQIGAVS